jgi:hydroxyacylglutathione hydrolase
MLKVKTLPFLNSNFAYAFFRPGTKHFSLVDPAEYESIATQIAEDSELSGMTLTSILSTHKHWDHAGENNIWLERHP